MPRVAYIEELHSKTREDFDDEDNAHGFSQEVLYNLNIADHLDGREAETSSRCR